MNKKYRTMLKAISTNIRATSTFVADVVWAVVDPHLTAVYTHLDKGNWSKRIALYSSLGVSVYSVFWAFDYATASPREGSEIAAIIAAVMIPVNGLVAAVFKYYADFKKPDTPIEEDYDA